MLTRERVQYIHMCVCEEETERGKKDKRSKKTARYWVKGKKCGSVSGSIIVVFVDDSGSGAGMLRIFLSFCFQG